MIKTYRPNTDARIEALMVTEESLREALEWAGDDLVFDGARALVKTLEGIVEMPMGSYLVRGTHGEFYPVDPEVFKKRWVETGEVKKTGGG